VGYRWTQLSVNLAAAATQPDVAQSGVAALLSLTTLFFGAADAAAGAAGAAGAGAAAAAGR
jgi:hypothetical protein